MPVVVRDDPATAMVMFLAGIGLALAASVIVGAEGSEVRVPDDDPRVHNKKTPVSGEAVSPATRTPSSVALCAALGCARFC